MFEYYCEACGIDELRFEIVPFKKCPRCGMLMFVEECDGHSRHKDK